MTGRSLLGYSDACVRLIHRIENTLLVIVLSVMIILSTSQIIMRNFFDSGFVWADALLRLLVLWVGLLGAMIAVRYKKHISIDVLSKFLCERNRLFVSSVTGLISAVVCGVLAYYSCLLVIYDYQDDVIIFSGVKAWLAELILPVCFLIMALRYFTNSVSNILKTRT